MVAYISEAQLKSYLRNEQSAAISALFGSIIEAASQAINNHCQRDFTAVAEDAVASALPFVPSGTAVLHIYDCTEITAVTESGTAVSATYWQTEPVGGRDGAFRQVPISSLRRLNGCWSQTGYPGEDSISVTAKWGWAETPAVVVTATRIVAARIVDEQNTRGGLVDFGDFAAAARRHVSGLGDLLDPLRTVRALGIA